MVARLFGPGLFSFVAACGFGTAAATGICFSCSMNHSARRPGRRFRLPHGEHGVFDVRRERDANTDLCRYVSYGQTAKYSLRADIFRSSTENGHPRQAFAFAKLDNGEAYR
jgi:hypothetical protein